MEIVLLEAQNQPGGYCTLAETYVESTYAVVVAMYVSM